MKRRIALALAFVLSACSAHQASLTPAVSPATGGADAAGAAPSIVLDARSSGPAVSADAYGASLDTWYDFVVPWVDPSLHQTGIHLVRFPGGSESDDYHWENGGTLCSPKYGYITKQSTFDHLMTQVARPARLDIAITLNYGSNRTCNGGGDPTEAAAWVAYAKQKHYNVPFWTVGNEEYGSWEYDLHPVPHDPHTYAAAVKTGYYPDVKAANPQARLGVIGDFAQPGASTWNKIVFREAGPFDFVEIHYYPEYNHDSDSFLLGAAIGTFANDLTNLRAQMTAAGLPKTFPIYLGEFNNDAGNEGKQSVSIVNALYLGQMLGVLTTQGVPMVTWWLSYGSCDESGDYSKSLYGWQHFGSEGLFSDGLPDKYQGCAATPVIPGGTPFPTARVMALLSQYVPAGAAARNVAVAKSLGTTVRAYGYANGGGYVLAAYNNTLSTVTTAFRLTGAKATYDTTLVTYGKAQYDLSKNNQWVGASTKHLGLVPVRNLPLTLPPYSLVLVVLI
ncbi:MAG: hypothetical protein JO241_02855 [Candidatus Eremiobacteraeota bacterium]|nr:hypothetical protein [Candidatus Eremiobacteraeota bacterium]